MSRDQDPTLAASLEQNQSGSSGRLRRVAARLALVGAIAGGGAAVANTDMPNPFERQTTTTEMNTDQSSSIRRDSAEIAGTLVSINKAVDADGNLPGGERFEAAIVTDDEGRQQLRVRLSHNTDPDGVGSEWGTFSSAELDYNLPSGVAAETAGALQAVADTAAVPDHAAIYGGTSDRNGGMDVNFGATSNGAITAEDVHGAVYHDDQETIAGNVTDLMSYAADSYERAARQL